MSARKLAIVLIVIAFIALFLPFIPHTNSSGQFFGAQYQTTADVSPTFLVFHCGSYVNSHFAAQLASGFSAFYHLSKGYTFSCVYNSA